jgi:hypothetical protein
MHPPIERALMLTQKIHVLLCVMIRTQHYYLNISIYYIIRELVYINLSFALPCTTNDNQLFYFFLCFHMVFNYSSLFMSMSNLI